MRRLHLLVFVVALLVAFPGVRNGFVYDDVPVVERDARLATPGLHLLAVPYWGADARDRIYRPLTTLSFAVDRVIGGASPVAFHVTNVVLHAIASLLVLALALRVLAPGAAALAALLFAVHPVHVEAVAAVVGRSELLAACGYLAALYGWTQGADARGADHASAWWTLLVLGGATVAYGGKEHGLTLPAALLLADWWEARRAAAPFRVRWRSHALLWVAVVALGAGYLAARAAVVGTATGAGSIALGLAGLGATERATVMLPAILVWLRLLAFPLHLAADYGPNAFEPVPVLTPVHALGLAVLAAALGAAVALRRRQPGVLFGLAWFAVTIAVASNVFVPTGVVVAERVLYLPSAGAAIAAAALWELVPRGRALWPLTAVALTLLAARAVARSGDWRDANRFVAALERDAPESYRTHWSRGARGFAAGDARGGEAAYRRALAIWPDPAVMQDLGEQFLRLGAWTPADRWLSLAFRADSSREEAATNAVLARLRGGRPDSASAFGEIALSRFPRAPLLLLMTAEAWTLQGRHLRALTLQRRAAFAVPLEWRYQVIAADGAARAGQCAEAAWRLARAQAMAPAEPEPARRAAALAGTGCRRPS